MLRSFIFPNPYSRSSRAFCFLIAWLQICLGAHIASATNRTVTNLNDTGAGSLRAVIAASVDNDTIDFSVTGTITLTSAELVIGRSITINGPGAGTLTVARNSAGGTPSFRIFHISDGTTSGPTVTISGLTIKNGDATNGTFANEIGAGILNDHGNLTVTNCVITGNNGAALGGGGVYNLGNTSGSATLTMSNCTISANSAIGNGAQGGGISSVGNNGGSASLNLTNCTITGNRSYNAGGMLVQGAGTLSATNCTFSGNIMENVGGAIACYPAGTLLTLRNCTISNNLSMFGTGGLGGGIYGGCTLQNTIVAGNTATNGPDVNDNGVSFTSLGHNLIGKTNASSGWVASDLTGTTAAPLDPLLNALEDNGGPTQTMALQSTSAAINAGDANASAGDQRHYMRAGAVDIGAFEFAGSIVSAVSRKTQGGAGAFDIHLPLGSTVTTLAGKAGSAGTTDGSGSAALFNFPTSAAVDSIGNVYVADFGNHTIRKITSAGVVSTFAGSPGTPGTADGNGGIARFANPHGVAIDSLGNVFVADYGNHAIRRITPSGTVTTFAGVAGSPGNANGTGNAARFNDPAGLAFDSAGNLYVADSGNQTIRKITSGAVVTTFAGSPGISGNADGTGSAARFNTPFDTEVDVSGNVYVADFGNDTIRQITPGAVVTTFAGAAGITGSNDGSAGAARFNGPTAVSVDNVGRVYVADFSNNTIRRIANGVVRTIAGVAGSSGSASGSAGMGRFNGPGGVITDSAGNTYVADTNNQTIRLLQTTASAIECRNAVSGNHQIVLDFAYPVSATAASITLDPVASGATGNSAGFSIIGSEVVINLSNVSNAQTAVVTLSGVNDGTNIGSVNVPISLLAGDANADGAVNSADIAQTKAKSGQTVDATNFRNDFTVDGTLNSADISLAKSRSGTALP